jgi:hypothetical protein
VTGVPRPVFAPWVGLALWATAAFVLAGALARHVGAWVPDAGVLFVLASTRRARPGAPLLCALGASAARVAVGVDPPVAVLAGYGAVAALHAAVGSVVDADRLAVRLVVAALSAAWVVAWLCLVHEARSPLSLDLGSVGPPMALRTALSTALVAPGAVPFLRRLPGVRAFGRPA